MQLGNQDPSGETMYSGLIPFLEMSPGVNWVMAPLSVSGMICGLTQCYHKPTQDWPHLPGMKGPL